MWLWKYNSHDHGTFLMHTTDIKNHNDKTSQFQVLKPYMQKLGQPMIFGAVAQRLSSNLKHAITHRLIYLILYHGFSQPLRTPPEPRHPNQQQKFPESSRKIFRQETLSICIPSEMVDPGRVGTVPSTYGCL